MHLVDEIFRSFKEYNRLEELKRLESTTERYHRIKEIVSRVNVFKAEIQDLTLDEQLYLDYRIQEKGVDLGLCSNFYIFYSNKHMKFHHICKVDNSRCFCRGEIIKCKNSVSKNTNISI
jgi:hypothetical protein